MSFNLATMLRESAALRPDKTLVHAGEAAFTYAEVDAISGKVAASLRALGLGPGDKVAVQLPNLPQFLFCYFGILKAGMTMVPLNPLLTGPEVAYHLEDSDARLLVTFEMFAGAGRGWPGRGRPAAYRRTSSASERAPRRRERAPSTSYWPARTTGTSTRHPPTTPPSCSTPAAPRASRRVPSSPTSSST